jgi:DNA mismatch endonuclease (patch repair protein)
MERILKKTLKDGRFLNISPERSRAMGKIRSKGNRSTEKSFRLALVRAGISGWVLNPRVILGTPDFYFSKENVAVFVDGCFWHGCKKCGHIPRTRSIFWRTKFERNKLRAKRVGSALKRDGTKVFRIWEHEVSNDPDAAVLKLRRRLYPTI